MRKDQRRNLVTHGLSTARWEHSDYVTTTEHCADYVFLSRTELLVRVVLSEILTRTIER